MPPEYKRELLTLILMIGIIGLVLIVTIILLMGVWRRHLKRQAISRQNEDSADSPDIWQAGGQRLLSEIGGTGSDDNHRAGGGDENPRDPRDPRDTDDGDYDDGYPREEPI